MSFSACRHGRYITLHPCELCEERLVIVGELRAWLLVEINRGYYTGDSPMEAALQSNNRVVRKLEELS